MAQFAPDFLNRPLNEVDPQIAAVLADESAPTSLPVIVGGVVGGVAVAAGAAAIIVFVVGNEMRKDEGFRYVVDTSGLQ